MRTADTIYDTLNNIDEGILNNNRDGHYILFMEMILNFILESGEIHFDYKFDLLIEANNIITRLYETSKEELKKKYYEMRELILTNLERIQEDKNESRE